MRINRISKPSGTVVSLDSIKEHLRVNGYNEENGLIETYINAAVDYIQQETWICAQNATYAGYMDSWCETQNEYYQKYGNMATGVVIKMNPVTEITSIKYYDENGDIQTMVDGTDYYYSLNGVFARINFLNTPTLRSDSFDSIEFLFKAGYLDHFKIPDSIIQLLNILVADFFNTRNSMTLGVNVHEVVIPNSARAIMRNISLRDFS